MRQIDEPNLAKRHSKLGIASIIIGVGLPLFVVVLAISFFVSGDPYKPKTDFTNVLNKFFSTVLLIVGLLAPPLHLTGLIFGLIGVFSKQNKKLFSIIGIILNLIFLVFGVGIFIYGLMSIPF